MSINLIEKVTHIFLKNVFYFFKDKNLFVKTLSYYESEMKVYFLV